MKKALPFTLLITFLLTLLIACSSPPSSIRRASGGAAHLPKSITLQNTVLFNGCTYTLHHPPELMTTDGILFESPGDETASLFIVARRRTKAEQGLSLERLAARISVHWVSQPSKLSFERVKVTDSWGETLDGLQSDIVSDRGQHVRVLTVVRPETLLQDLLLEDVVYEVIAQAPAASWNQWSPLFEIMFQTFQPKDCSGV